MVRLRLKQWEPGELRGSSRFLRAAAGAFPSADSPPLTICLNLTNQGRHGSIHATLLRKNLPSAICLFDLIG